MAGQSPPPPGGEPTRPTEPLRPAAPRQPEQPYAERERYAAEPPPKDPWWSNPWAAFSVGLIGVLLGALVGYLVGHNNAPTKTVTGGPPVTHTVTSTQTVPKVTTVTSKTVTQAPADEQKRVEAEEKVKTLERENEELRKAEGG